MYYEITNTGVEKISQSKAIDTIGKTLVENLRDQ
jgi:hypothetical protein